jgi:hypothetical protein
LVLLALAGWVLVQPVAEILLALEGLDWAGWEWEQWESA